MLLFVLKSKKNTAVISPVLTDIFLLMHENKQYVSVSKIHSRKIVIIFV